MKYLFIVFLSGFVTMSVELIAARVVAPLIGTSIFTWTSIIGMILFGISIGNYIGGKLIDKYPNEKTLAIPVILTSIFIALIPLLAKVAPVIVLCQTSLMIKTLAIAGLLFLMPMVFLGVVYPASLKLYTKQFEEIGKKSGLLSGLAALGSIFGTFLTGFLFVGLIGSSLSLYILAFVLFISSLLLGSIRQKFFWLAFIIIIILIFINYSYDSKIPGMVFASESDYYQIRVMDGEVKNIPSRILFLDFDSHSIESLNDAKIGTYQEIGPIFGAFKDGFKNILVIGGGSYNLPKDLSRLYKSDITVVEIDPKVTEVAKNFFNLDDYPIKTVNADGRVFLTTDQKTYDFIFEDSFNSFISIPWYLATDEATKLVKEHLNPGGIYALDFISSRNSLWLDSMIKTFARTFPNYYIVYFNDGDWLQSTILVGLNSENKIDEEKLQKEISSLALQSNGRINLQYQYQPPVSSGAIILRDDFAPTELLTASMIKMYINPYSNWFYSLLYQNESR